MKYTTVTVRVGEHKLQEEQVYVVEVGVTAEQILTGDDTGVICLCLVPEMAEQIAHRLSE